VTDFASLGGRRRRGNADQAASADRGRHSRFPSLPATWRGHPPTTSRPSDRAQFGAPHGTISARTFPTFASWPDRFS